MGYKGVLAGSAVARSVSPSSSMFPTRNYGLTRFLATMGGLAFMLFCDLHRAERKVVELLPFFQPLMHMWLIDQSRATEALPLLTEFLMMTCWEQGELGPDLNGLQYVWVVTKNDIDTKVVH